MHLCIELDIEDGVTSEHELYSRLESEFIETKVSKEGCETEIDD